MSYGPAGSVGAPAHAASHAAEGNLRRARGGRDGRAARSGAGAPRRTPATGSAGVSIVQEVEALFVESVAGQPYEEVVRAQVLHPLGLDHSHFFSDDIVG
jgi:CubicO group peptidase (beta-lactamase class C family)